MGILTQLSLCHLIRKGVFASAMVSGTTHEQAAAFGNLVASITIQQIGMTGTASPEQVRARWRVVLPSVGRAS